MPSWDYAVFRSFIDHKTLINKERSMNGCIKPSATTLALPKHASSFSFLEVINKSNDIESTIHYQKNNLRRLTKADEKLF